MMQIRIMGHAGVMALPMTRRGFIVKTLRPALAPGVMAVPGLDPGIVAAIHATSIQAIETKALSAPTIDGGALPRGWPVQGRP